MIEPFEVNEKVRLTKQAIGIEEPRITCNRLVKQVNCFQEFLVTGGINWPRSYKLFRLNVEFVSEQISCGWLCHGCFFTRRELSAQLVGDRLGYLALNRENVSHRAIVAFGPLVRASARVD